MKMEQQLLSVEAFLVKKARLEKKDN